MSGWACRSIPLFIAAGMDPVAKTKLIESLYKVLESVGVLSVQKDKVKLMSRLNVFLYQMLRYACLPLFCTLLCM